ncbi:MAG: NADH-quinone oxidoreductase subunit A [Candidatus Omnitrophota bacterium]|nr:NADH-quinone oxidoreductase subunit A [Candidatus Omnitrophota bacterium]
MSVDSYFYHYLFIGIFFLFAVFFAVLPLVVARVAAPRKPSAIKNATYECGLESPGDSWIQFRIQFYIYALIFVIFDVETVFIYPWAVSFKKLGMSGFVPMIFFLLILLVGLAYEWRKKALEWE